MTKGRFQKKKEKKVRNFPHFSGVGGFEKVIFRKKNMVSKCIKSPKYSLKSNLFFHMGGQTQYSGFYSNIKILNLFCQHRNFEIFSIDLSFRVRLG